MLKAFQVMRVSSLDSWKSQMLIRLMAYRQQFLLTKSLLVEIRGQLWRLSLKFMIIFVYFLPELVIHIVQIVVAKFYLKTNSFHLQQGG